MVSIKSLISFAALSVLSIAAPTADISVEDSLVARSSELVTRQDTAYVFACEHIRWGAPCITFNFVPGLCNNVPSAWNDKISSIRNQDKGRFSCVWWEHSGCSGRSYNNQEDANLADGDGFFNDRISSVRCNVKQLLAVASVNGTETEVAATEEAAAKL